MGTESFYSDPETAKILRDERYLEMNGKKKSNIVNAALKEYHRNHAPAAINEPKRVKIEV